MIYMLIDVSNSVCWNKYISVYKDIVAAVSFGAADACPDTPITVYTFCDEYDEKTRLLVDYVLVPEIIPRKLSEYMESRGWKCFDGTPVMKALYGVTRIAREDDQVIIISDLCDNVGIGDDELTELVENIVGKNLRIYLVVLYSRGFSSRITRLIEFLAARKGIHVSKEILSIAGKRQDVTITLLSRLGFIEIEHATSALLSISKLIESVGDRREAWVLIEKYLGKLRGAVARALVCGSKD